MFIKANGNNFDAPVSNMLMGFHGYQYFTRLLTNFLSRYPFVNKFYRIPVKSEDYFSRD